VIFGVLVMDDAAGKIDVDRIILGDRGV
jgi:hypothetical protein